jgi:integrase
MSPRRRKKDHDLPERVVRNHGAIYYIAKVGGKNKWIRLGTKWDHESKSNWLRVSEETESRHGTLGDIMDRYMAEIAPNKAPSTYRGNCLEVVNLRQVFGHMRPKEVRPVHIAKFLDKRGQAAPVRANREKALLSHIFTTAMRWGLAETNPCRGVARNKEKPRDRYVTDAEFTAVHSIANPTVQVLMDFGLLTGQRISDLLKVKLADINSDGVFFKQGKTGKRLLLEWNPDLQAVVDKIRLIHQGKGIGGLYLFHGRGGVPYTYSGISSMFKRAVKKALADGLIKEPFQFHDLRGKAATDADNQGQSAQRLLGHKSQSMTDKYIKSKKVAKVEPLRRSKG